MYLLQTMMIITATQKAFQWKNQRLTKSVVLIGFDDKTIHKYIRIQKSENDLTDFERAVWDKLNNLG